MKLLLIILSFCSFLFSTKPAKNARIIIEDTVQRKQVGYQETGEKGKAGFAYLNKGNYRMIVEFPQQEGKWIKEKDKYGTLAKASFDPKKSTYYYQGNEGYFAIKFAGTKRIESDQVKAVFREVHGESANQIVIAEFQTRKDGARIEMKIEAITARKFKKLTQNTEYDISTLSIPGQK